MSTAGEAGTPTPEISELSELERREIALERRIASLEARLDSAKDVFKQAARELAALEGMGGWMSRLTGRHARKSEASEMAMNEARAIVEKTAEALESAREQLAETRRDCAEARRLQQEDIERVLRAQRMVEGPIRDAEIAVEDLEEPERADVLRVEVLSLGRTAVADLDAVLASTRDKSGLLAGGPAALQILGDVGEYAIEAAWVDDPESLRAMLRHIDTRVAPLVDPAVPPGSGDVIEVAELRGLLEVCDDRLRGIAPAAESRSVHAAPDSAAPITGSDAEADPGEEVEAEAAEDGG